MLATVARTLARSGSKYCGRRRCHGTACFAKEAVAFEAMRLTTLLSQPSGGAGGKVLAAFGARGSTKDGIAEEAEALEELRRQRSGGTGGKDFGPGSPADGIAGAFGGTIQEKPFGSAGGGRLAAFSMTFTTGGIANEPAALEAMKLGTLRWCSLTEPMRRLRNTKTFTQMNLVAYTCAACITV